MAALFGYKSVPNTAFVALLRSLDPEWAHRDRIAALLQPLEDLLSRASEGPTSTDSAESGAADGASPDVPSGGEPSLDVKPV